MGNGDRSSQLVETPPPPELTDELKARQETINGFAQFDCMVGLIDAGLEAQRFELKTWMIAKLNEHAVAQLSKDGGRSRQGPIKIKGSGHQPPPHDDVHRLMDELCDYVNGNWHQSALHLAAYIAWRLNWIHPYADGNGRTSRAVAYMVLCIRMGTRLPGKKTIPDRIAANKQPYYEALEDADRAETESKLDVSAMEKLLKEHLNAQIGDEANSQNERRETVASKLLVTEREQARPWWKLTRTQLAWTLATVIVPIVVALIKAFA